MHESIIIVVPIPPASPTRLQYYCITIAQYSTHFRRPVLTPYTIQYCALQYLVKAKYQQGRAGGYQPPPPLVRLTYQPYDPPHPLSLSSSSRFVHRDSHSVRISLGCAHR